MNPVRTERSNAVYRGPTVDIGDAWVERATVKLPSGPVNVVYMDWLPKPEELELIRTGAVVRLGIWGMEPIPPVSMQIRDDLKIVALEPPEIAED